MHRCKVFHCQMNGGPESTWENLMFKLHMYFFFMIQYLEKSEVDS